MRETEPSPRPSDPFEPEVEEGAPVGRRGRKKEPLPFWLEMPILVLVALLVAVVIKTFFVQAFYIPSSSMEDTLLINDRVLVNKLAYRFGSVARGQVIVFDDPRGPIVPDESLLEAAARNVAEAIGLSTPHSEFIKRVIGLPGETIEIRHNRVVVDGEVLREPYVRPGTRMPDFGPVTIPAGHVFVMGDNRNASQDSRFFGPIPIDEIVGRAFVIMWPPSRWAGL